jgi:hypothetical protein
MVKGKHVVRRTNSRCNLKKIMLTFIIKNKTIINIYKYSVNVFKFINKYLYLLSIISFLASLYSTIKQNKFYKILSTVFKLIIIINIIVGTGFILYFTDYADPFTFSFYYEIFNSYIDFLKNTWNEFMNYSIEDSIIKNIKSTDLDLKNEIKEGVKQGVKEAFDEIITEMSEKNTPDNTYLLKQFALASSVLLFSYFFFVLPGASISPEDLSQYNWMNQSLIEFKITVKNFIVNLFSNPSNPGNPGATDSNIVIRSPLNSTSPISPTTPTIENLNTYLPESTTGKNVAISPISEGVSTVTPNTPRPQFNIFKTESETQTILDGISVGKMVETVNILADALGEKEEALIKSSINIKNITD